MAYYLRIELKDRVSCSDLLEHPETAYAKVFVEKICIQTTAHAGVTLAKKGAKFNLAGS
jgi:hypothetical protein